MQACEVFFDSVIKLLKSEPIPLEYNPRADSRFEKYDRMALITYSVSYIK